MRICEIFRSIQGEGLTMGLPTTFVRTVGCNLRCSWCDTQYSMEGGEEMSLDEIMEAVGDARTVCVTGGEPLLQPDMPELIGRLLDAGKRVVVETNGAIDISFVPDSPMVMISMDVKCPSSGMTDRMLESNMRIIGAKDQLKYVIADDADYEFAVAHLRSHSPEASVIFTPVGGTERLEWLVARVLEDGIEARVLPQLHKIIWGDRKGV
ncbi:MAG: radical SAM protein [Candidatus Methanomethylophilaceae archaeon]|nr:radical SAM protein [Candidatus Methanomethylophilaceae archaeon]